MPFGPFGRGLKLVHRLMFSMTSWLSNSICPITFSLAPFTLWGLGWKIYPAADATEIMLVPFGLFVAVATTLDLAVAPALVSLDQPGGRSVPCDRACADSHYLLSEALWQAAHSDLAGDGERRCGRKPTRGSPDFWGCS